MSSSIPVVDGDGHIFENYDAIWEFMPEVFHQERRISKLIFPELDNVHRPAGTLPPGAFDFAVDQKSWVAFADELKLKAAVLYPTFGLASGCQMNVPWARAAAHAYNTWLHSAYLQRDQRFKGMALIPLQDPQAAADELRRAVTELGFCGGMLPAAGYKGTLGDREYWPIYRAADQLGCALAVHGGSFFRLGLDSMGIFAGTAALGHPYGILNAFTAMTFNGIFDRFPNARFGFLEAGVAWLFMALERFDGSYKAFKPYDPDGELLKLRSDEKVSDHLITAMRDGRIFIGIEGDEPLFTHAVRMIGSKPFVFSSDYPHEVNPAICRHEIEELLENPQLTDEDKEAILHRNAERVYGVAPSPASVG
jgi:predicted TIM-barrel fold metal-dependent hydrolase